MELILIRHALPKRVIKEDGSPADPGLSDEGIEQARKLARWMQTERLDAIYSSPMNRAKMTAEFIANDKEMEIIFDPGVMEFDNQSSTYVPMEELRAKDYERWRELVQGGFEARIDVDGFRKRVIESVDNIVSKNKGNRVAVVCHGGIINVWAAYILGIDRFMFFAPEYTSINRFLISSAGTRSVASLNESSHLRDDLSFIE